MKYSIISILVLLLFTTAIQAQNLDETEEGLVINYLRDASPGAEDVTWMRVEGTDRIRISFVDDDVKEYALVNTEGVEFETGSLIDEDDIPGPTDAAFHDSKYSEWDVLGIYISETPRQGEMYRFDVSNSKGELVTLYFNELGESITVKHNVNPAK
jgi:hypothetical protein